MASINATIEWFGATTFRLRISGLTIFLDTWLEKPSVMPTYLSLNDVDDADYIFISHAHFDHLPGADILAKRTGATVVANGEAINMLVGAGVPEDQLFRVSGGERVALFTRNVRDQAKLGECELLPAPPGAPPLPHPSLSVAEAHIWPSLHCLMTPGDHPTEIDTATVYEGAAHPCQCTLDITRGMEYGLLRLGELMPRQQMDEGYLSFLDYVGKRDKNLFSSFDGGQIMVNFIADGKSLLWNAHLGAYEGIMRCIEPKPHVAILGIAGRANFNGRPWDGSAAQFALKEVEWLEQPGTIIWCLHDESPIKPYRIKTDASTRLIEEQTSSRIMNLNHAQLYNLNLGGSFKGREKTA